jgi:hypothetical protein
MRGITMRGPSGRKVLRPASVVGSAVLWGLLELIALQRSRLSAALGQRARRRAH